MALAKSNVTIKGTKDGLVFQLDDQCSYQALIDELSEKLQAYDSHVMKGPFVQVSIQLGYRYLTDEQQDELREMIRTQGNFIVDYVESQVVHKNELELARQEANVQVIHKTIRSGQVIHTDCHALILGDVNPGGCIKAAGNIYVIGSLRGMAHAGCNGKEESVIAASILQPTQLRIAGIVSRPPDEWETLEYEREFAYAQDDQIVIDKLYHLGKIRPEFESMLKV